MNKEDAGLEKFWIVMSIFYVPKCLEFILIISILFIY